MKRAIKSKQNGRFVGIKGRPPAFNQLEEEQLAKWVEKHDIRGNSINYKQFRNRVIIFINTNSIIILYQLRITFYRLKIFEKHHQDAI